jgi:hypothetical protein
MDLVENRMINNMITCRRPDRDYTPGDRRKRCCKVGVSSNLTGTVSLQSGV